MPVLARHCYRFCQVIDSNLISYQYLEFDKLLLFLVVFDLKVDALGHLLVLAALQQGKAEKKKT